MPTRQLGDLDFPLVECELIIKPCPFCGGSASVVSESMYSVFCIALCDKCKCHGPLADNVTQAIELWNKRLNSHEN